MVKGSGPSRVFINTLIFIFIASLFVQPSAQKRLFVHVPKLVTQSEAKQYCRDYYTDLATFRNETDKDALTMAFTEDLWIGLQRNMNDTSHWYWSDGDKTNFTNWHSGEPNNSNMQENCVVLNYLFWNDLACNRTSSTLCYEDEPILVQENKTWEEALDHCRNLQVDPFSRSNFFKHVYDLLQIRSPDLNATTRKVVNTLRGGLWIGARFLAGDWMWLDGTPLLNLLSVCPVSGNSCGTVSTSGEVQFINCSEKRMFLCSRN